MRDGRVEQAIADTLHAHALRAGFPVYMVGETIPFILQVVRDQIDFQANCYGIATSGWHTWYKVMRCLLVPGYQVGSSEGWGSGGFTGGGGGGFSGGGATGSWGASADPCENIKIEFDAEGNLIVPSLDLPVGGVVEHNPMRGSGRAGPSEFGLPTIYININAASNWTGHSTAASKPGASVRRALHLANMGRARQDWYGVLFMVKDVTSNTAAEVTVTTTAYRRASDNALVHREVRVLTEEARMIHGTNPVFTPGSSLAIEEAKFPHKRCPEEGNGGDFHFYAVSGFNADFHGCVMYFPRPEVTQTPDGYAINPFATLSLNGSRFWPAQLSNKHKDCYLRPEFLARLTDALLKEAQKRPGYTGIPSTTVIPADARPGDTRVADLEDTPGRVGTTPPAAGAPAPAPTPNPTPNPIAPVPPPPPAPGAPPPPTNSEPPGWFDRPGAPDAEPGEAPTGIMDPVFDWLPDLPSMTVNTAGAACPVWTIDATAFANGWTWQMTSHCELLEGSRSAFSAAFLIIWSISAGLIVLRA